MRTTRSNADVAAVKGDVLIVTIADPGKVPDGPAAAIDGVLGGTIAAALKDRELRSKAGSILVVHTAGRSAAKRVLALGIGDGGPEAMRSAGAAAGRRLRDLRCKSATIALADGTGRAEAAALVEAIGIGNYRFSRFRSGDDSGGIPLGRLAVTGSPLDASALARVDRVVAAVDAGRDLGNTPGNHLTPTDLAEYAIGLAEERPSLECTVMEEDELREIGANAILCVAQGSDQPAKMIVLRHRPTEPATSEVLGLVGKAVTFDTGGISIKPAAHMEAMKLDMGGGAAVIEATAAIADLGLPVEVLAVVPATENMPSGRAIKPGDIVTALNGKTIEIRNTDAEGRLILADALTWCARNGATRMVDIATLTGGIVVALGSVYTGLFASDDDWANTVTAAGAAAGDPVWRLPLHPDYDPLIRSKVADLSNAANKREAVSIYAAQFLREFAEGLPWAHLDIACTGMVSGAATGVGVRLMVELADSLTR